MKHSLLILAIVLSTNSAWAFNTRFGIDPAVQGKLAQLKASGMTSTRAGHNGDVFWADSSAVVANADAGRLFQSALDYDDYVSFKMPHLSACHVVERDGADLLYVWSSMSILTLSSQDYLEVHVHPDLGMAPGARGMEWQLADKKASWPYPQDPAFKHSDGSFYIEPLADGGGIYVRYFLSNEVSIPLPGFLINGTIESQLSSGAAQVIKTLIEHTN